MTMSINHADHMCESAPIAYSKEPPLPTGNPVPAPVIKASETQVGGDHYTSMGLQPLEACYRLYGYKGLKATIFTKVMKYINRNKDNEVEQLQKARHCIDLLIEKAKIEEAEAVAALAAAKFA